MAEKEKKWSRQGKRSREEAPDIVEAEVVEVKNVPAVKTDDTEVRADVKTRFQPGHKKIEGSGVQKGHKYEKTIVKEAVDKAVKQYAENENVTLADLEAIAFGVIRKDGLECDEGKVRLEVAFRVLEITRGAIAKGGGGVTNNGVMFLKQDAVPKENRSIE